MFSGFLTWLAKFMTGGILGRVFDTIDKKVKSETDRERLKAEVTKTWLQNQIILPWWLDAFFIVPLGLYWAFVLAYSAFWCAQCMAPQSWIVAALPSPMDQWAGWIVLSRFGAGIIGRFGR